MDFHLLLHEAWPAYEQQPYDGWILRYAGGVTKRANSVLPLGEPGDLGTAIGVAEDFYASRGQRCVFSMGPGTTPELDRELAGRGYELVDPTVLMVRSGGAPEPEHEVRVEGHPWQAWLETWWAVDGRYGAGLDAAERICAGVPAWYAAVEEDGVPLAVGRAVPQGDTLGIYCMATLPRARRRGLGRSVLRALLRGGGWGSAYLCTTAPNETAQALYRAEGFEMTSGYHYRVR
ncbi:GNAT family N-acetyltransferase [Nonomuraea lactucae]|uniref:GNAT family N-acetyltransferase n=1 Tax=Nonomuraea lactucae TaxID=2249762 RepID=UPI000DE1C56E|nr:GNAT family N-acetyltransferase [Nonomuraea lactucae]